MGYLLKVLLWAREEAGQSMTEYALIMVAVAVVAMLGYGVLGNNVSTLVTNVAGKL